MKFLIKDTHIKLEPRQDWLHTLDEQGDSDSLFYEITYSLTNENAIVFAELIGQGSSKMVRINFNTTKGRKIGDFKTDKPFFNVYFPVEKIRFYSSQEIAFNLSIYSR